MTPPPHSAAPVWLKRHWQLRDNPFPTTGIARLGGKDVRENGLLFDPAVNREKLTEVQEKFVLGTVYSGLKFAYLWSTGTGAGDSDARGFGKSVLMQHLVWSLNQDWGRACYEAAGLDETDAEEDPICALLTSFDTTHIRSLQAALFTAVEYAVDFRKVDAEPTLAQRLRERLVARIGSDDPTTLTNAVADEHRQLRGRTLGPPDENLIQALCDPDPNAAADYLDQVTTTSRTRKGGVFLATFLLFVAAAGVPHVLLCCDQLEDLASTSTAKAKRVLETERFRDILLETLPMADMVGIVVTMHPRAAVTIGQAWQLADLPPFEMSEANKHRIVILPPLHDVDAARKLLWPYLNAARKDPAKYPDGDVYPLTEAAVTALFDRSNRKPRDVLRKAHGLVEAAASENIDIIDADAVARYLDAIGPDIDDDLGPLIAGPGATVDWSEG